MHCCTKRYRHQLVDNYVQATQSEHFYKNYIFTICSHSTTCTQKIPANPKTCPKKIEIRNQYIHTIASLSRTSSSSPRQVRERQNSALKGVPRGHPTTATISLSHCVALRFTLDAKRKMPATPHTEKT